MRAAILDVNGVVRDTVILDDLSQRPDAVQCPDHIGIGMRIDDPVPLESPKADKLVKITKDRDAACFADVTVLGHPWQADIRSQQMLASAILLAQAGVYTPTVWRDANNVDVPIANVGQLVAIAGAMAAQTQAAYAHSWARKQALEAATTVEDVEAV